MILLFIVIYNYLLLFIMVYYIILLFIVIYYYLLLFFINFNGTWWRQIGIEGGMVGLVESIVFGCS